MLAWTGRAMTSASQELRAAGSCGCTGFRLRAAQFPLNAGTEAALTKLLHDHMHNYGSSHGQVTSVPHQAAGVSLRSKSRGDGDHSRPFASG